jgi:putative toxin-antitoxin system antitoxin component (TIGR02293 family)
MATTPTATKTRQKTQQRRAAGKALTATARSSPHDYTKLIGVKVKNHIELVKHVEKGLAFTAVEALQRQMDLATKEMARLLDIKFRTFLRRKEAGRLQPAESDRVLRASRLFARAQDLFDGDQAAARGWLMKPQRALGGAIPLERHLLNTA